jgi:hypothetical protein
VGKLDLLHVGVCSYVRGVLATQLQVEPHHVGRGGGGDFAAGGVRASEPHPLDVLVLRQRRTHRRVTLPDAQRHSAFSGTSVRLAKQLAERCSEASETQQLQKRYGGMPSDSRSRRLSNTDASPFSVALEPQS